MNNYDISSINASLSGMTGIDIDGQLTQKLKIIHPAPKMLKAETASMTELRIRISWIFDGADRATLTASLS